MDFTGLNPADPDIYGFVTDVNAQGIPGATVNLHNVGNKLMQSAVTSSSGHYEFRFSNPGTFTLTVTPPAGYAAPASATVTVQQFEDARVDFTLTRWRNGARAAVARVSAAAALVSARQGRPPLQAGSASSRPGSAGRGSPVHRQERFPAREREPARAFSRRADREPER